MAIIRRTVIDQIEIGNTGIISVRLALQVIDEEIPIASRWHRTVIEPGVRTADQMAAVNAHLTAMGEQPCSTAAITRIAEVANRVHTPAVIAAYRAR